MHRLLVALLAAFDALVAGAVGVAVVTVPVIGMWVFSGMSQWASVWPVTGTVWQLGGLVPVTLHLPAQYVAAAGIAPGAATFVLSLAPLALTGLTVVLAARSGLRAGRSGAALIGVLSGVAVYIAVAVGVWMTCRSSVAVVVAWQAVLLPGIVYAASMATGAVVAVWGDGDARGWLGDVVDDLPQRWRAVPASAIRGAVGVLVTLGGLGAVAVFVALVARSGQIVSLYQAGNLGGVGGAVVSLAQLAYLPTLIVWGFVFLAGPGFAVGTGTAVSPAGTDLGVLPGIPALGALPTTSSPWLLVVVLLPVGAGALAGWMRRRRTPALAAAGLTVRVVLAVAVAALSGAGAAGLAGLASGAFGPGRLAQLGPRPGVVALAVGVEVLVGAAAFLLAPRRAVPAVTADRPPEEATAEPVDAGFFWRPRDPAEWRPHDPTGRGGAPG